MLKATKHSPPLTHADVKLISAPAIDKLEKKYPD